jgi:undecaprenyl-diphosphatase
VDGGAAVGPGGVETAGGRRGVMDLASLPPWYELVEGICLAVLVIGPLVAVWTRLDRPHAPAFIRRLGQWRGGRATLVAVIAASALFIVAEDVLDRDRQELLPALDIAVRDAVRVVGRWPGVRLVAGAVNDLTGPGLAGVVLTASIGLVALGRRYEALVLIAGTLSAWGLSAALKLGFAVPRPHPTAHDYAITGYGFPSGHTLVTLVAAGLIVWAVSRLTAGQRTLRLYAGAVVVGGAAGVARVLLGVHWLTDVLGGLALGVLWLLAVIAVSSFWATADRATPGWWRKRTG